MKASKNTIIIIVSAVVILLLGVLIVFQATELQKSRLLMLAYEYTERNEYERALDLIEELLLQDPENTEALRLLSRVLALKNGETEDSSIEEELQAETADEQDKDEQNSQANTSDNANSRETQTREEDIAIQQRETQQTEAQRAEEARRAEQAALAEEARRAEQAAIAEEARIAEQRAQAILAQRVQSLLQEAQTLKESGNNSEALEILREANALDTNNPDVWYELANAQFDEGLFSRARTSYQRCLDLEPQRVNALFNLGLSYEQLNNENSAIQSYNRLLTIDNSYAAAYNRIGEIFLARGEYSRAQENLERALILENTARNNRSLARAYYEQGNFSEALEYFMTAVSLEANRAQNHYNVAVVLLDLEESEDALQYAGTALSLDRENPEYNYTMGLALKNTGEITSALELFARAISLRQNYIKPRVEISEILISLNDYPAAISILESAYSIDSNRADVNNNLGTVYRLQGDFNASVRHSLQAVNIEPQSPLIRYNLALSFIGLEQFDQAEQNLRRTLELDSAYLDAYLRLADVLLAQERQDEAKELLRMLTSEYENSPQAQEASRRLNSL